MNRRTFVKNAAAFALVGGCRAVCRSEGDYSVSILGDTHYDAASVEKYHRVFAKTIDPKATPWYPKEFARNGYLWREGGPSRALVAASACCVTPDTRFVLQLGDLVQGDCDTPALQRQMLAEMAGVLETAYPSHLPILSVCGNHDVRPGGSYDAYEVYRAFAEDWRRGNFHLRRGEPPKGGLSFSFRQGPDAWIVLDFVRPDVSLLKRLLEETEGARHTFVCLHAPVLPMSLWHDRFFYLSDREQDEERRAARRLLARRRAIVLTGHEHCLECRRWEGDGGSIVEFVANSIVSEDLEHPNPAKPNVLKRTPGEFGRELESEGSVSPLCELYREYRAGLRSLYAARGAGHYRLDVSATCVDMSYYGHDAVVPDCSWRLLPDVGEITCVRKEKRVV